jgi:hypothetical protein
MDGSILDEKIPLQGIGKLKPLLSGTIYTDLDNFEQDHRQFRTEEELECGDIQWDDKFFKLAEVLQVCAAEK